MVTEQGSRDDPMAPLIASSSSGMPDLDFGPGEARTLEVRSGDGDELGDDAVQRDMSAS
jgi:hypothetical protein